MEEASSSTEVAFLHGSNWPELTNRFPLDGACAIPLATFPNPPPVFLMPHFICLLYLLGLCKIGVYDLIESYEVKHQKNHMWFKIGTSGEMGSRLWEECSLGDNTLISSLQYCLNQPFCFYVCLSILCMSMSMFMSYINIAWSQTDSEIKPRKE